MARFKWQTWACRRPKRRESSIGSPRLLQEIYTWFCQLLRTSFLCDKEDFTNQSGLDRGLVNRVTLPEESTNIAPLLTTPTSRTNLHFSHMHQLGLEQSSVHSERLKNTQWPTFHGSFCQGRRDMQNRERRIGHSERSKTFSHLSAWATFLLVHGPQAIGVPEYCYTNK